MPKIALNQEQWRRVEEIYHEALEHRPESRIAFVTAACGADSSLWREVESLLATDGADALVILTEWPEFGSLDLARVRGLLQRPLIVDGRNMYSPETMRKAGFSYWSCGREPVLSQPVTARRSAGDPPTLLSMIPSLESVSVTQRTGGP